MNNSLHVYDYFFWIFLKTELFIQWVYHYEKFLIYKIKEFLLGYQKTRLISVATINKGKLT